LRIVLDTLGGDNVPAEIVRGGLMAAKAFDLEILFAGDETLIEPLLPPDPKLSTLHAPQAVTMEDAPAEAVRRKKDSSLVRGIKAVHEGDAQAFVSPANTGAVMAASLFGLGRVQGIERPGIAVVLPTVSGRGVLVLDVGANTDCSAENLFQFAIMGHVYARRVMDVEYPRLALVNIGSEPHKGNDLVKRTRRYLENFPGFVGNIEPNHLFQGEVDVAVCDGFVGNVLLKAVEGGVSITSAVLKSALARNPLSVLLRHALRRFKRELDPSRYGGAPLLGVRGITIVAHGNANAEAIKSAVGVAKHAVECDLVGRIDAQLSGYFKQHNRPAKAHTSTPS